LTLVAAVAAWWGLQLRNEYVLSPGHGLGYLLGITGGLMMLALLLYPLRKRLRIMAGLGQVHRWFRWHMMLGIVGPLCILFHCNFSLGAVNSNVALASMGLIVSRGLVGRFLYSRIHYGLYGEKASLNSLQEAAILSDLMIRDSSNTSGEQITEQAVKMLGELKDYVHRPLGPVRSCWRLLIISPKTRLLAWQFQRKLAKAHVDPSVGVYVSVYADSLRRLAGFGFFERMFSWWHTFHMPIFFMLVITGSVHVWAVHHY